MPNKNVSGGSIAAERLFACFRKIASVVVGVSNGKRRFRSLFYCCRISNQNEKIIATHQNDSRSRGGGGGLEALFKKCYIAPPLRN